MLVAVRDHVTWVFTQQLCYRLEYELLDVESLIQTVGSAVMGQAFDWDSVDGDSEFLLVDRVPRHLGNTFWEDR